MTSILIVDDQPHLRELVSEELEDEGFRVASINETESVDKYLKCLDELRPDLVLLDLYLNGPNGWKGWDVLRVMKRRYPHLPVVIITAYDSYAQDPRLAQADGYVVKDFAAMNRLKEKITEVLARRPTASAGCGGKEEGSWI